TVIWWLWIVAVNRRVRGDGCPVAACKDNWKSSDSVCVEGEEFGSRPGLVGNNESGLGIWVGSGISERPLARRICISAGDRRFIGKDGGVDVLGDSSFDDGVELVDGCQTMMDQIWFPELW
ncbi:hypothetical protein A2U01_0019549, partial [Trifolium medium]|nr:hypothetical protein [Trifolium medium]